MAGRARRARNWAVSAGKAASLLWADPGGAAWARFAATMAREFVSEGGEPCEAGAAFDFKPGWPGLAVAWRSWAAGGDIGPFRDKAAHFVRLADAARLRHRSWAVRAAITGQDALVGSRVLKTLLEAWEPDDPPRRRAALEAILAADPAWAPCCLLLGEELLAEGDLDGARRQARAAMSLSSTTPAAADLLRRASLRLRGERGEGAVEGINLDDLGDRFCPEPFRTFGTASPRPGREPSVFGCHCGAWLPIDLAQGRPAATADDVWNGPAAQEIRRSILDGDYRYCSRELCPALKAGTLPRKDEVDDPVYRAIIDERRLVLDAGPRAVQLSHDPTCNLACPSCRTELILARSSERDRMAAFHERVTRPLLRRTKGRVNVTGYGDPFGSKHYRQVLAELNPADYPDLSIDLVTNAQLLTERQWDAIRGAHPMIRTIGVSIDAATAETYEVVRRPGKWNVLLENLAFLSSARRETPFGLNLFFVVQTLNYREMPAFVELGERLGVDAVVFQRLFNMGSFTAEAFAASDVQDVDHPEHGEYLRVLQDERMRRPIVNLYNAST